MSHRRNFCGWDAPTVDCSGKDFDWKTESDTERDNMQRWMKYFDADTVARLSQIGFTPGGLVEGNLVGNHPSPFHGFAIEFSGHRGYVPGDDVRHLDWKVYYRTGRYLMKQYEQETNLLAHVFVDVSESMNFEWKHGRKLDYAAWMATSLAQVIVSQSDSVDVRFFDRTLLGGTQMTNSDEVIQKVAMFFEGHVTKKEPGSIGSVLSLANETCGRRRIIFVISDFFADTDATFDGIKRLLGNRHEVILLHVVDPLEISFDIPGRVKFLEMEGEDRMEAEGIRIRESYEALFGDFLAEMKTRSRQLGIDYMLCDMSRPFGIHLAEYLSSKQRMKR